MQILGTLHIFNHFVAVVEEGKSIVREQYVERTEKWISFSGAKFEDGFMATLTDITELKKSQQSLQLEAQFSKGILNASLNGIYVLEAVRDETKKVVDFILLEGNQKFSELTGWPIEEVIGKSFATSFPAIKKTGFFDLLCQVIESGEPHRQATYFAETFMRWYDYIAVRLGENSVVVTFQEITQIKEAAFRLEQQKNLLDSILKHSPSGIAVYTAIRNGANKVIDFQCILANDAAEVFTQVPNIERLTKTVSEITPGLKDTPLFQMAVVAVETGQPFQTQYYREDIGKWLELSVVKMYDNHLINLFRDITPMKETEGRLEKSINDLKVYNAELEQFAYITSHDLQEPLRKIRIFNTMAYEQLQDDNPIKKQLQKIDESAKRMSGIISSLLDYSRIGNSQMRFQKTNLNKIIQDILVDFELLITEKCALVKTAELPEIEANALQMNQLFFNLVGNALKFTKKNTIPVITIQAQKLTDERKTAFEQLQKEKEYVEITVQDNGIGFNPEYAKKIFTVFQRLNDRSLYSGYGIGLAICKKTVDSHNGIIYAEGAPKEGAKFTVILPYKQK
jgi:signal transduction histidine kinase